MTSIAARLALSVLALSWASSSCKRARVEPCAERVERFRAHLAQIDRDPSYAYFDQRAAIATVAEASLVVDRAAPLVTIRDREVRGDYSVLGQLGDAAVSAKLIEQLEQHERNRSILHPDDTSQTMAFYVLTDRQPTLAQVLELVRAVPPRFNARLLVLRSDQPVPPDPLPAAASAELRKRVARALAASDDDRNQQIASLINDQTGSCATLPPVYKRYSAGGFSDRRVITEGVSSALRACDCDVGNIDAVEAGLMISLTPTGPSMGWLPIHAHGPNAELLALDPSTSIAQAATALASALQAGKNPYLQAR